MSNAKTTLKFSVTSGSSLSLTGATEAKWVAEDKVEVEGGGKIQVG